MFNIIKRFHKHYKFIEYLIEVEKKWNPPVPKDVGDKKVHQIVKDLNYDGIVVLPDFFSGNELESLQNETKKLANNIKKLKHAYQDKSFRIYNVCKESKLINKIYSENDFFNKIAESYYGKEVNRTDTVYQESYPSSKDRFNLGFGISGFHFDGIPRRFKIFIYLEDVEIKNGPFTYIYGSNKIDGFNKLEKMYKQYVYGGQSTERSYDHTYYSKEEEEKYKLWEKATPMIAKAGSVIIAETRGLHIAGPITSGCRKILVNYYR